MSHRAYLRAYIHVCRHVPGLYAVKKPLIIAISACYYFYMLAQGYTLPSLLRLGSPRCWHDFTPVWYVVDWCAPDWLKNQRRLSLVPACGCRGATKRFRPTSKRPTVQTRSNVISIRDQHAIGFVTVNIAYMMSPRCA